MEQNYRFRNHISIIFESAGKTAGFILVVFLGGFLSDLGEISKENVGQELIVLLCVLLGCMVLAIGWQWLVWLRTYISVLENTIVVEKNLLNRKKNTISIKNVSNINLEQNLFQMLIGTCRVKLDTNSLSTANETDVSFVLKKKEAEAFRKMILLKEDCKVEHQNPTGKRNNAPIRTKKMFVSSMDDIVMHGLFSINLVAVVMAISVAVILVGALGIFGKNVSENILELFASALMLFWILAGWVWNVAKNFLKYMDFQIQRIENKIFLNYGIFKKVAYSIPVDKINAIRLSQGVLGRMANRYMVEVINVGMDDDASEEYSFFLPYGKREKIEKQLKVLLPEFNGCFQIKEERQPKCVWVLWIPMVVLVVSSFWIGMTIPGEFFEEFVPTSILIICTIAILSLMFATKLGEYFTVGLAINEKLLKITSGYLGKRSLFVKYDKIQFVTIKQNILAKHFGVQRGQIHILAATKNQVHMLPYFRSGEFEKLREYILK